MHRSVAGFTLIELVMVIVILAVVSVGIGGFIRSGVQIYVDVSERDQLLSQSRFVVERLNRELRNAVPGSVRIKRSFSQQQCLEYVPIQWSSFYTDIPVSPEPTGVIDAVELLPYSLQGGEYALVYPTSTADVYDLANNKRQSINSCSDDDGDCNTTDLTDHIVQLDVDGLFAQDSPASRLYIVKEAVSYCIRDKNIYRHTDNINATQTLYTSGGVLMAEGLVNNISIFAPSLDNPFRIENATLNRNGIVYLLLRFARDDEQIVFSSEVHIPNVP